MDCTGFHIQIIYIEKNDRFNVIYLSIDILITKLLIKLETTAIFCHWLNHIRTIP